MLILNCSKISTNPPTKRLFNQPNSCILNQLKLTGVRSVGVKKLPEGSLSTNYNLMFNIQTLNGNCEVLQL